ncbi:MAG: DUF4127 family protein [Candidatus Eremiobacteraeota bacterium]|nr:DUF4127 family protein [Candidatus Eremiobacteraeota bacterium]
MNILFIPLDNRPCTMNYPEALASMVNFTLLTPPAEYLGNYFLPGNTRKLFSWLGDMESRADAALISIDMLVHGGLIASRGSYHTAHETARTLKHLGEWLRRRRVPMVASYNVIMRTMPTSSSSDIAKEAPRFLKIVKSLHEISLKKPARLAEEIEKAKKTLKGAISGEYFDVRRRNHEVNRQCLLWRKEGLLDCLLLGLDDVVTRGLNLYEKTLLEKFIRDESLDNAFIYPGTDEMALMLLTRLACERFGEKPRYHVLYSSTRGKNRPTLYEDRNVPELISSYFGMLSFEECPREEESIDLFVHLNPHGQQEAGFQVLGRTPRQRLMPFMQKIEESLSMDRLAAVADVAYANGADCTLAELLTSRFRIPSLAAYAAWNTAGNTIGTVISQSALRWLSLRFRHLISNPAMAEKAHLAFTFSRFLDDWIYQSEVREKVKKFCTHENISTYDLGSFHQRVEHLIDGVVVRRAEALFHKILGGQYILPLFSSRPAKVSVEEPFTCQIRLPWPRIFEIDAFCDFTLRYARGPLL